MTSAFLFVAVLLVIGVALRLQVSLIQSLYIPASVIAGALGLVVVQLTESTLPTFSLLTQSMRSWPAWLIAVVFAGMLLERKPAPWSESLSRVGRQALMVWVIVLGQTAAGMLATWLLIQPFYNVPNSMGMLIETGFAGGHGTAAAMGEVYRHPTIQLNGGLDLGVLMATGGLVYGIVSGIVWINLAGRLGWIRQAPKSTKVTMETPEASTEFESSTGLQAGGGPPIGLARISGDAIDPLLLQVVWLALAFGVGLALQSVVEQFMGLLDGVFTTQEVADQAELALQNRLSLRSVVTSFPLFIYTLFGGWAVRWALQSRGFEDGLDAATINRLTSSAMDVLVVSAIVTLNMTAVATLLVPFSILFVCGAVWSGCCLFVVSRWLLPKEHWFQLGLINYGMSTGTTATGFVLLRLVDPELESGAAEDYAMAAPLSSPFIGGGMVTVGLPLLVLERVPIALSAILLCGLVCGLILVGFRWNQKAG